MVSNYRQVAIITDSNVGDLYREPLSTLQRTTSESSERVMVYTIPAGESSKTYYWTQQLTSWLLTHNYQRDCCLIALGGGVVGDVANSLTFPDPARVLVEMFSVDNIHKR